MDSHRSGVTKFVHVGLVVEDLDNTFLLCYVRGPEGLIVELAERRNGAPG